MTLHTPLYPLHIEQTAKMTSFAGWQMPLQYQSQLAEHKIVRESVGMFDTSHMRQIDLHGNQAAALLEHVFSRNVGRLAVVGASVYGCMLNDQGGIIDDLIVYRLGDQTFRAVVNAATAANDWAWLQQNAASFPDVTLTMNEDQAMIAVQGRAAAVRLGQARPAWQQAIAQLKAFQACQVDEGVWLARTGYTGEDGYEIMLPGDAAQALWRALCALDVTPCGLGARDTLRLEAGLKLYGQDMDQETTPEETGLRWLVDKPKAERAPRFKTLGVQLNEKGVLRAGVAVRCADGDGVLTSGSHAPSLGYAIGIARLPLATTVGAPLEFELRGQWRSGKTVKMPFYKRDY